MCNYIKLYFKNFAKQTLNYFSNKTNVLLIIVLLLIQTHFEKQLILDVKLYQIILQIEMIMKKQKYHTYSILIIYFLKHYSLLYIKKADLRFNWFKCKCF